MGKNYQYGPDDVRPQYIMCATEGCTNNKIVRCSDNQAPSIVVFCYRCGRKKESTFNRQQRPNGADYGYKGRDVSVIDRMHKEAMKESAQQVRVLTKAEIAEVADQYLPPLGFRPIVDQAAYNLRIEP